MSSGAKNSVELTAFEMRLQERFGKAMREAMEEYLAASDVDADAIEIEGKDHRRVLRSSQTYMTAVGEVKVERWLYKDRRDAAARSVAALDAKLGIVERFWTPEAAKQAAWVVTQMTPKKSEVLLRRVGKMTPSKSSLDRLPKAVSELWEDGREGHEQALREALVVPEGASSVIVSIDGVMGPIEGAKNPKDVRGDAAREGRFSKGPAGYRELGCAMLAFCDEKGELLSSIRFGGAPESLHLELRLAKIADAGGDNWEYFGTLPEGPEILDFFHGEHLAAAVASVYDVGGGRP